MSDTEIRVIDLPIDTSDDGLVEAYLDLQDAWSRESKPGDPLPPRSERRGRFRSGPPYGSVAGTVLASSAEHVIGYGVWEISVIDNPQSAWIRAFVLRDERRQGVGSAIVSGLLDRVEAHGAADVAFGLAENVRDSRSLSDTVETVWGTTSAYVERIARLELRQLDPTAVEEALRRRESRIAGRYRAVSFDMDELPPVETGFDLDDYASMVQTIWNLMPLEEIQQNDEIYTSESFRRQVERSRIRGRVMWNCVAIEPKSRRCVGVTNISFNASDPRAITQLDTGVLADHQGNGLGMYLKLRMLQRVLRELPEAEFVDTENAVSNAAMIHINESLGFREQYRERLYQVGLAELRKRLAGGQVPTASRHAAGD